MKFDVITNEKKQNCQPKLTENFESTLMYFNLR